MNCVTDYCSQGRQPCPTPWQCGHQLHRVTVEEPRRLTADEVMSAEYEAEQDAPGWLYLLIAGVALACLGVVALPFVMGAV